MVFVQMYAQRLWLQTKMYYFATFEGIAGNAAAEIKLFHLIHWVRNSFWEGKKKKKKINL